MTRDGIEVRGSERLARTLKDAAGDLADLTDTHRQIGAGMLAAARSAAPKRTGRLAASITVTPKPQSIELAAGVPYAAVINYGSPRRGIRARPYLTGTVDHHAAWIPLYKKGITAALKKVRGI